jgi:predicted SAM-dependent methyltransferase
MKTVNIEDAAHIIFFHPEWEEAVLEDLREISFVEEEVKEKIQKYSLQIIATTDRQEQLCIEEVLAYLSNLLNVLKKKGVNDERIKE